MSSLRSNGPSLGDEMPKTQDLVLVATARKRSVVSLLGELSRESERRFPLGKADGRRNIGFMGAGEKAAETAMKLEAKGAVWLVNDG